MADCVDLEIEFGRDNGPSYRVVHRVDFPNNPSLPAAVSGLVEFDFLKLAEYAYRKDFHAYGACLRDSLFDPQKNKIREDFQNATNLAVGDTKLRLRLVIDDGCPELHGLLWETVLHPFNLESPIATSPEIYFSRVLRHGRPRAFTLRERANIRALVLIADPAPPSGGVWSKEDEIDLKVEKERAVAAIGTLTYTLLVTDPLSPGKASLANLIAELKKNPYDLLYLVCHGTFDERTADSILRLESQTGSVEWVSGKSFVTAFERLPNPPTIAILCSCSTAGPGNASSESLLAGLGPRLVQAGVPTVIAMQGLLSMPTASLFFPRLFRELMKQGVIDRAVCLAREEVERRPDFHIPVLFHRLRSGRLWYGNDEPTQQLQPMNWAAHVDSLKNGKATLVLGSALLDPYLGSQADVATQLAHEFHYAFADSERDDFAMVCQFIQYVMGRDHLERSVARVYLRQLIREYRQRLPELQNEAQVALWQEDSQPQVHLQRLLLSLWRQHNHTDPISIVARLPFKAYISTNPDTLLQSAMPAGRKARVWSCGLAPSRSITNERVDMVNQPDPLKPLLVYLQGTFEDTPNMILTEHDYYNQLSEAAKCDSAVVKSLNSIFTGSALIFLGFRMHEWDFRILYRRIQLISGWGANKRFFHVAVQIDPASARGTGSETVVRMFLEQFLDNTRFQIFRGSVSQFVQELKQRFIQGGGKLHD